MGEAKFELPSREVWARQVRSGTYENNPNVTTSRLSAYATADEIAAIVASLKQSYRQQGRLLREAKQAAGPAWIEQEQERTGLGKYMKWRALPKPQQEMVSAVQRVQQQRRDINAVLKLIASDELPNSYDARFADLPELAEVSIRWKAAWDANYQAWQEELATRPIDDAAWEKELRRRKDIEEWLSGSKG
jgi:hypothetical protein